MILNDFRNILDNDNNLTLRFNNDKQQINLLIFPASP